ncbi:MAG TPA: FAD-dependent oxidoreductase, partial [Thermoguttaceae bacterium]|nr:FAD-dependent oxidoreductase [Thermoguttaceae bacterium]
MRRYQVEIPTDEYWRRQIKCQDACPVNTDARGYVRAIAEGRFEDAYLIARGPNPLASICGRVCGAPCEAACRRGDVDQAISIRALKRFVTDRFGPYAEQRAATSLIRCLTEHISRRECGAKEELSSLQQFLSGTKLNDTPDGPKVAIIGSGPAGLAAAHDLALLGMRPTVYEMEQIPAGMLAVGIPEYRLPRDLIAAEVELIRSLGVEFICNTTVGRDISLDEIRSNHQATILAVGLKQSARLKLPGSELKGVVGGVELLRDVSVGEPTELKGDVVVIGGGNVAYDVARTVVRQTGVDVSRTALRQAGVGHVHLCCLESLEEMPADDIEIIEGDEEGVLRHHSVGPTEILSDEQGHVRGVAFQKVLRVFDAQGRFSPEFDANDVTEIAADTVIWAIGQRAELSLLEGTSDIEMTERGNIQYDEQTQKTSAEDVFVAGDISYGPKLLIDAVASGKQAARAIYKHLTGKPLEADSTLVHLDIPDYVREADYEKIPRTHVPTADPQSRRKDQQVTVELGFGE